MTDAADLLPCPFCGGDAREDYVETSFFFWVECCECGVSGNILMSPDDAREAWNKRISTPPIALPVQPTSAEYAQGYGEGFNDACKPAQPKEKS